MDLATAILSIALQLSGMQQPRIRESIVLYARTPSLESPSAVTTLTREALDATPSATVDDALRSVPGFSLFRRSSSRVANPTTQGATLRGLAASGSSRALVLADEVPLNDPVGGWVYWNRIPSVAIEEVSVARGAAGDLVGSDAIGGVITIRSVVDTTRLLLDGGSGPTGRASATFGRSVRNTGFFAAGELFNTNGFVIVAPESRGPIDERAASRHGSAHAGAFSGYRDVWMHARGSYFRETRENGTPFQQNDTTVTQASVRLFPRQPRWSARAYALTQAYHQTFSAVGGARDAERPTSEQRVSAHAFGGSVDTGWTRTSVGAWLQVAGRRANAELNETSLSGAGIPVSTTTLHPHQTSFSIASHGFLLSGRAQLTGGARLEFWQADHETTNRDVFVNPRLSLTYHLFGANSVNVALRSGTRAPTMNELYRPFRVGNIVTQANAALKPETVRGVEVGISANNPRRTIRALGFWSRVHDAITNVTLSSSGGTILRQRQNAARIRASGVEVEAEVRVIYDVFIVNASTSYTRSVFTAGPLEGLRVPQVPQWHHAIGARGVAGRVKWAAEWRYVDEQFDDDRNLFPLDQSAMLDARIGWMLTRKIELFGAMENVLDEEQDVGRTPIRTIGLPRTSRVGFRVVF